MEVLYGIKCEKLKKKHHLNVQFAYSDLFFNNYPNETWWYECTEMRGLFFVVDLEPSQGCLKKNQNQILLFNDIKSI